LHAGFLYTKDIMKHSKKKRPTVGLALGGGGVKGMAHIGVLKTLIKNKIPIDYIVGTSVGAVIGGFYAVHGDIKKLEETALSSGFEQVFSLMQDPILGSGLVDEKEVYHFIKKNIGAVKFNETKIPFCAVATSAKTGEPVYIDSGTVFRGIRASMAIPPFFSPLKVKNDVWVDGAYADPVPARQARAMGADVVLAVNLEEDYLFQWKKYKNVYGFSLRSVSIFIRSLATLSSQSADVVIAPHVARYDWGDLDKAKKIIRIGEKAAKFKLDEIKKMISRN